MIDIYVYDEKTTTTAVKITTNIRRCSEKYVKRIILSKRGGTSFSHLVLVHSEGQRCFREIRSGGEQHYVFGPSNTTRCH
jgi:hypothetical protein